VTDRLVVGVGPTVDLTLQSFDPAFFAPPNDANGDGVGTFPSATHYRPFWGGGFRAGLVYSLTDTLDVGFGYTSPQWLETWKFYARDELGNPQTLFLKASLPAIYSWGVSYRPMERLILSTDLRYFDYKNTDLFGTAIRDGGLGWRSVFAVAVGGRYWLTERLAVQAGYQYNTDPVPSPGTLFNIQAPAITQNLIAFGATAVLTESLALSLGYSYAFENSVTGTVREVPGANIRLSAAAHTLLFNLQVKFGARCAQAPCRTPVCEPVAAADPVATPRTPATLQ
jgi:long-chain fatty acid transport protein